MLVLCRSEVRRLGRFCPSCAPYEPAWQERDSAKHAACTVRQNLCWNLEGFPDGNPETVALVQVLHIIIRLSRSGRDCLDFQAAAQGASELQPGFALPQQGLRRCGDTSNEKSVTVPGLASGLACKTGSMHMGDLGPTTKRLQADDVRAGCRHCVAWHCRGDLKPSRSL